MLTFSSPSACVGFIDAGAQALRTSAVKIACSSTVASWSSGSLACQPEAQGTCLLALQIPELVLLILVEYPEVLFLSLADDGENPSYGFANIWDLGEFGSRATCHFGDYVAGTAPPSGLLAV